MVAAGGVAVLVTLCLLTGLATLIVRSDREARAALEDEQVARADVAAAFVGSFFGDIHARQLTVADDLTDDPLPEGAMATAVERLGSTTAVLLDARGVVLAAAPPQPSLVGREVASAYDHLRRALVGEASVSRIVPSGLVDNVVIAFAVPFDTPTGTRVLTGGFSVAATPVDRFLRQAVRSDRRDVVLVDDLGGLIAGNHTRADVRTLAGHDAALARALEAAPSGTYHRDGEERWYVSQAVDGTPWSIVASLPTDRLYGPVGDLGWIGRVLFAAFVLATLAVALLVARQVRAARRYERLARIDQLTGIPNRRHLQEALDRTAALGQRHRRPMSVLLIDVDHFKHVNDTHGHKAGDRVLADLARALSDTVRTADLVGRWGGEEFLAVLPETDVQAATTVAERLRERASALTWPWADLHVTVTVGVGAGAHAADQLLMRADAALYAGKERGRDRVEVVDHPLAPELVADRRGALDRREPADVDADADAADLARPPAATRPRHDASPS